jgi:integrase
MPLTLWNRNGIWWARGRIKGKFERRSTGYPVSGGKRAKDAAAARAAQLDVEIRQQHDGQRSKAPTLKAYWTRVYQPSHTAKKRAPRVDRYLMAHALPVFGDRRMDTVTVSECQKFLNTRRSALSANPTHKTPRGIAEGSVQRLHGFLQGVWNAAIKDGLLEANPWAAIKRRPYVVRRRLVTAEEQEKLLTVLTPTWQRYLLFMIATGLRLDGCRNIDPETDLDLERRTVTVTEKYGKTRTVPFPSVIAELLKTQLKVDGQLWPQDPSYHREVLANACTAAKIPHRSPHDLRHTFGHRWLKGGGDIYTLATILGDSLEVTAKHYSYLSEADVQAKAATVDLGVGE